MDTNGSKQPTYETVSKAALALIALVVLATVVLAWIPPAALNGMVLNENDLSTTAAAMSAIGTLTLAYVTFLSLRLSQRELEELRRDTKRRNVEKVIEESINPLIDTLREIQTITDGEVGYTHREDAESTTNIPSLDERDSYDVVDQDYLSNDYPEIWDDISDYNESRRETCKKLDDQYEAYFEQLQVYCYRRRDEFEIDPEKMASILAYAAMGELQEEVDSVYFKGEKDPLDRAIEAGAEIKGTESGLRYDTDHSGKIDDKKKAENIEENLLRVKKKLQREYEVRDAKTN